MSLETAIQNLADAINNLARTTPSAILQPALDAEVNANFAAAVDKVARKPRGPNKPKDTDPHQTQVENAAETAGAGPTFAEATAAAKAAAVAARVAAVSGEAIAKKTVQDLLLKIVSTHPDGRNQVGALCRKLGAPNLSGFDNAPNVQEIYAQLIADANLLLAPAEAA
jgi:hypothetical protein